MFCTAVIGLIGVYFWWRDFERTYVERRRQWIRDVNKLAEWYGHPELAGTPDNPNAAYVKWFEADQSPAQVIAAVFGPQQPTG